jgi:integrase
MEDKIDIHKAEEKFKNALKRFEADEDINPRNKEIILRFISDCKIGKTIKTKAKKKIREPRLIKYLYMLKALSKWLNKPFDEVHQEEMEKLVLGIEENVFKKKETNYSEETKLDYKKVLKKFYKWLGRSELLEFVDMSFQKKDVPAITREEMEKLVNSTPESILKATIIVLFDGGARAEEFLNLRIKDLTKKKYDNDNDCYWINIRHSKTFARNIPLPLSTRYLSEWLDEHPQKNDPEAQLFPFSYNVLRQKVSRLSLKVLKKRVWLHMLRHSSATYWAPRMNRYQLCAKYGWAFSSDMPDRYIERKGIIFDQIAEKGDIDQTIRLQKENRQLMEKMENLEQEYNKVRKALEFIMPLMENIEQKGLKEFLFEKRKIATDCIRQFYCAKQNTI